MHQLHPGCAVSAQALTADNRMPQEPESCGAWCRDAKVLPPALTQQPFDEETTGVHASSGGEADCDSADEHVPLSPPRPATPRGSRLCDFARMSHGDTDDEECYPFNSLAFESPSRESHGNSGRTSRCSGRTSRSAARTSRAQSTQPHMLEPWYSPKAAAPGSPRCTSSCAQSGPLAGTALVVACSYKNSPISLSGVCEEASQEMEAFEGAAEGLSAVRLDDPSLEDVCAALKSLRVVVLFLSCHGDAKLPAMAEKLPLFMKDGLPEAHSCEAIVNAFSKAWATTGPPCVLVLNGCCTLELGKQLGRVVPYVVCWETIVNSAAAKIFGTQLAQSLVTSDLHKRDGMVKQAYRDARAAVLKTQVRGQLENGTPALIPRYALDVDPLDRTKVHVHHWACKREGPGCCKRQGRLFTERATKGPYAAGTPRLLIDGEISK